VSPTVGSLLPTTHLTMCQTNHSSSRQPVVRPLWRFLSGLPVAKFRKVDSRMPSTSLGINGRPMMSRLPVLVRTVARLLVASQR